MNRRQLLKALIASPLAAAAGAAMVRAAKAAPVPTVPVPFRPHGNFTVYEALGSRAQCSYRTSALNAPELGSDVVVEHNGCRLFSGSATSIQRNADGTVDVHAESNEGPDYPNLKMIEYRDVYSVTAINYPEW